MKFRSAAELISQPTPPIWLLHGWFELACLVLFFGDAASAKTWLVVSMSMHVAAGFPWFGHAVRQGAVFIIAGEGNRGLRRRLAGISRKAGIDLTSVPLFVSDGGTSLSQQAAVAEVIASVRDLAAETGHNPVLIVIDTLSRNYGPGDENSSADASAVIQALDWLRETFNATVLVIHHVGHGDRSRARGSTVLRGALDAEYRIQKDEAGVIEVVCTKAKDFEAPPPRHYSLIDVPLDWIDEDGLPVRSAAVQPTDAPTVRPGKVGRGKNQVMVMRLLHEAFDRHRARLIEGNYAPEGARVSIDELRSLCAASELPRNRIKEVLQALQDTGQIRLTQGFVFIGEGFV